MNEHTLLYHRKLEAKETTKKTRKCETAIETSRALTFNKAAFLTTNRNSTAQIAPGRNVIT